MGTDWSPPLRQLQRGIRPPFKCSNRPLHQLLRHLSQAVVTALGPTILDVDVAALDEAGFLKTQAEGRNQVSQFCR